MARDDTPLEAAADALLDADAAAVNAAEEYRETRVVRAISVLSGLGDQPQIRTLSAALIINGLLRRDARLARAGARMLASHELATFVKNAIKHRIDRTRPRSRDDAEEAPEIRPGNDRSKEETSFPSGHSAGAASAARAFAREFPEHSVPAHAVAGAVALTQIPRCAHYPTDVGAGLLIGIAAEGAVNVAWGLLAGEAEQH